MSRRLSATDEPPRRILLRPRGGSFLQNVDILAGQRFVHAAYGAEFAAHAARLAVVVFGGAACADGFGGLRVDGFQPLRLPIQFAARRGHAVVLLARAGNALGDVGGVGGDTAGDDALFDVVHVGQGQMFGGRDVAQEGRAVGRRHRAADGGGDVVVAGSDVGNEGAEHVKRRAPADALLHFHVGGDLIQRHVPRAFDHDLNVLVPGAAGQFAEADELLDLTDVGGVGETAGAAGVAEADGDVVLAADVEDLVEMGIKRVFLAGHAHPGEDKAAAAADDVHRPSAASDLLDGLARDAAVERDEINAVFRVQAHHVDEILSAERGKVAPVMDDRVVHGHGADHGGALAAQLAAERPRVAVAGQVHDRLRAQSDGAHHLLHFHVVVRAVAADAEIDVDLGLEHAADAVGIEAPMPVVGGDHGCALGHPAHQFLDAAAFFLRDDLHFRRDDAASRRFHLRVVVSFHVADSLPAFAVDSENSCGTGVFLQHKKWSGLPVRSPLHTFFCVFLRGHYPNRFTGRNASSLSACVTQAPRFAFRLMQEQSSRPRPI